MGFDEQGIFSSIMPRSTIECQHIYFVPFLLTVFELSDKDN